MYNINTFEEKANSLTEDRIKILEFNGVKSPCKFVCLKCGQTQDVKKGEVLVRKGKTYQCQFCHTSREGITKANYQKLLDAAEKADKEVTLFTKTGKIAIFKCKKCNGEFSREPLRFLKNQSCPMCESRVRPLSIELVKKQLKEKGDFSFVDESQYSTLHSKVLLRHGCGFIWSVSLSKILNDNSYCPKCSKKVSKGERAILKFLDKNQIVYIYQWKRLIDGRNHFFDFYLPDNNLVIEFQGEQHYTPVNYFGGEEAYKARIKRDDLKRAWCKENDIRMLEISWKELNKIPEILEAQRLKVASSEAKEQISQADNDIV